MMDEEKEPERRPFWKSVRNYFREYCNCTSIHGFRYFGEKRTYFERFWWLIVFSITLAACVYAIHEVYQKWVKSPVIVSFATKETPIYSIPFPAVTICSETKSILEHYNHTKMIGKSVRGENLTDNEQNIVDYMAMVCDQNPDIHYSNKNVFSDDFYDYLEKVTPINPLAEIRFMGKLTHLNRFKPIITDEGICYSFNILDRSQIFRSNVKHYKEYHTQKEVVKNSWSMENGYTENASLYPHPLRALLAGAKNSLEIILVSPKSEIDHTCKSSLQGFRVSLHIPSRIPRPSQEYFQVPVNEVVLAAVYPDMMTTSDSVKTYNPKRRECYFPSERHLKYFRVYTSNNCKLECLTNYTLNYCGCVNFYMPRDNTTQICGTGKLECMAFAEENYELGDLQKKIMTPKKRRFFERIFGRSFQDRSLSDCDCMPLCSDLSYNVHISQNPYDRMQLLRALASNASVEYPEDKYYFSKLIVFFKSAQFITSQRHELYGPTDFLANFGGLLGLFTGFSILSLMEAIYFLTVRLFCNSRLYGFWAGPDTS
ncbi:pickpocket protein 28-like [Leptinotarsa decemlineata]|uniref:pickpocket protein 28-like n=1 Tax=Leptinotarsa decemlineata TaxID=7539 RepID=UPI003D304E38